MTVKKYDSSNIKILNKKIILRLIHKYKTISRNELAQITGLKSSSVTRLASELIEQNHVYEAGTISTSSPGRKKIVLKVNPDYQISLLYDIGVAHTTAALGYYDGSVSIIESFSTPKQPQKFFEKVIYHYNNLSKLINIKTISFSVPGMVDIDKNVIINAPNLGWKNLPINDYLSLKIPILADNEANLSVLAEKYYSKALHNLNDIVFVIIREGVGTGVMLNNNLFRGRFFSAGEFGHMTIDINSEKKCHCGKTGCWELYSSIRYALNRASKELNIDKQNIKFQDLFNIPEAKRILLDMATNIGKGLVNIVNSLNPEAIILGGEVVNLPSYFYRQIIEIVRREALKPASQKVVIIPTTFKDISSNLIGANISSIYYTIDNLI
ncbi:MAG: ROK family transcriptional regulator [Fervidobacterium sp.]